MTDVECKYVSNAKILGCAGVCTYYDTVNDQNTITPNAVFICTGQKPYPIFCPIFNPNGTPKKEKKHGKKNS